MNAWVHTIVMHLITAALITFQGRFSFLNSLVVPIVIGFEESQYNVSESVGSVEVFVSVFMPVGGQMLVGGVPLVIQSVAGSAGKDYPIMGNF